MSARLYDLLLKPDKRGEIHHFGFELVDIYAFLIPELTNVCFSSSCCWRNGPDGIGEV